MDRQRVSAATPSAQRNATRATPHAATKCHQRCKSTSALGCAKEHDAVKPGCCHERAHARTKWKRSAHTPSKHSVKRHSCSNRIIHQLSTVTSGNQFQTRSQDHARPAGVPDCRLGCVPAAVQVKTARAVKRTSRTWAAAASAHLCGRFWRRFFCRPPLSLAVAGASDHKTLRRSAEDIITSLMRASERPRFRTRACQLTQARRRVTTTQTTALGTPTCA